MKFQEMSSPFTSDRFAQHTKKINPQINLCRMRQKVNLVIFNTLYFVIGGHNVVQPDHTLAATLSTALRSK
jgi:hypothetical protein